MEFVIHRVNQISELKITPKEYGCEIDVRTDGSKLILHHDPFAKGDNFIDYLDEYKNGTLVLNIKESGIEELVLEEVRKRNIESYFLLDVEFPYLYSSSKKGEKNIAVRFSEMEPIENAALFQNTTDWVWIDTITKLPLNKNNRNIIKNFKSCLVCPSRWGNPHQIGLMKNELIELDVDLDLVMTKEKYIKDWI
jgi:hypothetical protein